VEKCLSSGGSSDGGKGIEIIAVHSQTSAIPNCPAGWEKLWDGYSLAGSYANAGYQAFNDLGSSGSCVEEFHPTPFIECYIPGQCDFLLMVIYYSIWLDPNTSDTGSIIGTRKVLPHISQL
jgi:integrin beta 8